MKNSLIFKPRHWFWAALFLLPGIALAAGEIEEVEVHAPRLQVVNGDSPQNLSGEDMDKIPGQGLDEILKINPSFSLFRRAGSFSAHPTTQGPSLAAIGANGTARALVVLDGIPLNDPFGGWVYWSAIDPGLLRSVDFLKGGSLGPWGSGGLSGTVEMVSKTPANTLEADVQGGSFSTFGTKVRAGVETGETLVVFGAGFFRSDGFFLVPLPQRGPVDIPARLKTNNASLRVSTRLLGTIRIEGHFRHYSEDRVNGLSLSTNQTGAFDGGVRLIESDPAKRWNWEANLYARDRQFSNSFASVSDGRSESMKVLDQFDVPATEMGLNGRFRRKNAGSLVFEGGLDVRILEGFTNEHFRNLGAGFTRLRVAGGRQLLTGVFAHLNKRFLNGRLELKGAARIDYWRLSGGVLREESLEEPGHVIRDDVIPNRRSTNPTGALGVTFKVNSKTTFRAHFYTGFRVPTLNEFFRPFRVGNDITEANPELAPEKLNGVETGVTFRPTDQLLVDLSFSFNRIRDGIGNITLGFGPGVFPPTGFVPPGGVLRKRENIELITNKAFEALLKWSPNRRVEIRADYLFQASRIKDFPAMPALEGNFLIQAPRHRATLLVEAEAITNLFLGTRLRVEGSQFDDDQNLRVLPAFAVVDFTLRFRLNKKASLTFSVFNLFDKNIVSALNADGLVTLGQPRMFFGGVRVGF